jgi:hypothetical protein
LVIVPNFAHQRAHPAQPARAVGRLARHALRHPGAGEDREALVPNASNDTMPTGKLHRVPTLLESEFECK